MYMYLDTCFILMKLLFVREKSVFVFVVVKLVLFVHVILTQVFFSNRMHSGEYYWMDFFSLVKLLLYFQLKGLCFVLMKEACLIAFIFVRVCKQSNA